MSVRIDVTGEVVTAYLGGEIDHHNAIGMREAIDAAIKANAPTLIVLDFSDVTFMDSSGIGLVMGRYRTSRPYGAELFVTNTPAGIYKVMKLAGIERLAKLDKGDNSNEKRA